MSIVSVEISDQITKFKQRIIEDRNKPKHDLGIDLTGNYQ